MPKNLLIAEQDRQLTDHYLKNLSREGLHIQIARDGQETIDLIEKKQPDLLLMYLLLPKEGGFSVLRHIQEKKYRFPVVVLSYQTDDEFRVRAMELGATEYLMKGDLTIGTLRPVIEKYFDQML